jgi:hypothetical protein
VREQPVYHKDLLPVNFVVADMAGRIDSPLYGMFAMRAAVNAIATPGGGKLVEYFIHQPEDPYRDYALKWDGESQITYETFRDMGAAYGVGLILIYLLVVAQCSSASSSLTLRRSSRRRSHGHQHDRDDRAGRDHRAQLHPAGRFHQPAGQGGRRLQGGDRQLGDYPRAAHHAHRPGRDARRLFHPRRSDLQRSRDLTDLRIFCSTVLTLVVIPLLCYIAWRNRLGSLTQGESATSWQLTRVVAGTFHPAVAGARDSGSPIFHSQWWLAFTAFVGVNLLQSGRSRWCLMETIMRKLGASSELTALARPDSILKYCNINQRRSNK